MNPKARQDSLVIRELADETLVYDLKNNKAHCLNRTAGLVLRHCDGQTTTGELAQVLHQKLQIPADERVVRLALEQLTRANLLQGPTTPMTSRQLSRRALVGKLGVAMALVPVVMSLSAPKASAQASPGFCPLFEDGGDDDGDDGDEQDGDLDTAIDGGEIVPQ